MDEIYFLVRYTPFWSIPLLIIGAEFSYISWIRKKKKWFMFAAINAVFALLMSIFYYWIGGPEKSVRFVMDIVRFYTT
tara:strand:+ start:49039 stop:49272 length:234 start_codon:yes stop_codon:yes gene_type:complete